MREMPSTVSDHTKCSINGDCVNLTGSCGCQACNLHYSLPFESEAGRIWTYLLLPIQEITGSESSDVAGFRRYVLEQVCSAKQ